MTIRKESKQYIRQQRKIDADLVKRPNEILKRTTDDGNLKLTFKSPTYYEKDIVVTKNAMLTTTPLIKTYASLESLESFILDLEGQEIITYNLTQNTIITDVVNYNNGMSYKLYLKQDEVGGKSFVFDETISNITLFDNFQIDQTPNSITQIKIDVVEDTLYVQSYVKYIKNLNSFEFTINTTLGTGSSFNLPLAENYNYDFVVDWGNGETSEVKSFDSSGATHTYSTSGEYQVKITGTCEYFAFNDGGDKLKLIKLNSFNGDCGFKVLNFYGCENLAGEIPKSFTNLHKLETAERLFHNCSNLTGEIPEDMFWNSKDIVNCSFSFASSIVAKPINLTGSIPEKLFANNPLVTTFLQAFNRCSNLTGSIPEKLFWNNPLVTNFYGTFSTCSNLTGEIPEKLFANNKEVSNFSFIFDRCSNLTGSIPEKLFANNSLVTTFKNTFQLCTGLTGSIPEKLFANNPLVTDFSYTFNDYANLTGSIPEKLFANNPLVTTFYATFSYCANLTGDLPENLFTNNKEVSNFSYTFWGSNKLTGRGWENIITNAEQNAIDGGFSLSKTQCFRNCTSLTDYGQIPVAWR